MTLSITGLPAAPVRSYVGYTSRMNDSLLPAPFGSSPTIADSVSQTVTLTITQSSAIHTDLGAADDTVVPVGTPGGWWDEFQGIDLPRGSLAFTGSLSTYFGNPQSNLRSLAFMPF